MIIKHLGYIKGFIWGVIFSILSSLLFMLFGQAFAGGITSFWGESWLYFAVIVPFTITFVILGGYFSRRNVSNKKLWLISLICAFFVTLYSGTIGAIFGEMIVRGGIETVNIEDTLVWGTIYAFVLLPLTIPFSRLLIGLLYALISKKLF